jgi:hypothetical protein
MWTSFGQIWPFVQFRNVIFSINPLTFIMASLWSRYIRAWMCMVNFCSIISNQHVCIPFMRNNKKTTCAVSLGHFTYLTTPCPLNTKSRYWWARWWCRADTAWWTQSGPSIQEPADLWIFKIPIFWAPIIAGGCGISPDLTSPIDTYNPIVVMWYTQ